MILDTKNKTAIKRFNKLEEDLYRIHSSRFDYSKFKFTNMRKPSIIICNKCGLKFSASMDNHINKKSGCPSCSAKKPQLNMDIIKHRVKEIHGNRYTILTSDFKHIKDKLLIKCNNCNNEYKQVAFSITRGIGCPYCNKHGFNNNLPGILYYIKIDDVYKIGITNRTVAERFQGEMNKIKIIKTFYFDKGIEARLKEKEIKNKYKEFKYVGVKKLKSGHTEMFNKDILILDL